MNLENAALLLGNKGGQATKEKYGLEHYKEMNKKSVESRRKKKLKLAKKVIHS